MSRIRADQLVNRAGSGGPKFPNGVAEGFSVSGIVTATSFAGNLTGNVTGNADTATTATNAQGLTGTPNITVGTVTGTDATFSGNLTVNGTTTTIDTAVTAVDSLAVDGAGTFGGVVEIGGDANNGTAEGIELNTSGFLQLSRSGNSALLAGYTQGSSTQTVRINNDGSATFAAGVSGVNFGDFNTSTGHQFFAGGAYKVRRNDSNSVFQVFQNGTAGGDIKADIKADGSAEFAGSVDVGASVNLNDTTVDLYSQTTNAASKTFQLFSDIGGTKVEKAFITADGTINDSIGPLRRLDIVSSSVDLTLSAASHAGRLIRMTSTNRTFTIPSGSFSSGDMITIFHVGTGNMTIAQGSSVTLYNAADGATGNRTLAAKGMVTIACTDGASNEFVISGSQLT